VPLNVADDHVPDFKTSTMAADEPAPVTTQLVVDGHTSWLSATIPAGSVTDDHAVPLVSVSTPADELVVSRAKQGMAVDGQVRPEIDASPVGTVSFLKVAAFVPETHNDPAVVLQ